nr:response regulator transcription factor [Pseudoalteromonas sp. S16_S37]
MIVEDDNHTAQFISDSFTQHGYSAQHTSSAEQGLLLASTHTFDVIIFDRMLPNMDGLDAVRILRQSKVSTPIILLTALGEKVDRVAGLNAGADDYLAKPFAFSELLARVNALSRRPPLAHNTITLSLNDLKLCRTTRTVTRRGVTIDLMPKEYQILEYLMLNPQQLVTKTMLLEQIWGFSFDPKTSLVQTHLSRLRNKIDKPFDKELIKTIRGQGYLISD